MTGLLSHLKKSNPVSLFFSRFLSTGLLCRFKKLRLSNMQICFTLIVFCFVELFDGQDMNALVKKYFTRHGLVKAPYMAVALW